MDYPVLPKFALLLQYSAFLRQELRQAKLSQERIARLDAIGFCWDIEAATWDKNCAELVTFKEAHGHCNVAGNSDGDVLGRWCTNVRHNRKDGALSPEKIVQLDAIGFRWGIRDDLWEKNYAELVAYRKVHGHCDVPHGNNPSPLGSWCAAQRRRRKSGKIIQERVDRLDAIGFDWNPIDSLRALWEKNYAELVAYKEANGHLRTGDGSPLGVWCGVQRSCYKRGKMTSERIAKLEAIGFPWNTYEDLWDKNYAELLTYKKIHGHCKVPRSNGPLGSWCSKQRHRKARLSQERIAQLDALGFCWQFRSRTVDPAPVAAPVSAESA